MLCRRALNNFTRVCSDSAWDERDKLLTPNMKTAYDTKSVEKVFSALEAYSSNRAARVKAMMDSMKAENAPSSDEGDPG